MILDVNIMGEIDALSSKVKKITVDQSKVLKNRQYRLFRYFWATRYSQAQLDTT